VTARLLCQARLRSQDVTVSCPPVGGAARDFSFPEMTRGGAAMLRGALELGGCLVVELRLCGESFEAFAQFQTLTSR
jgi:hypothetical protein